MAGNEGGIEARTDVNDEPSAAPARRRWSTPVVITSDLRRAGAHVGFGSDGSDPFYGPYGS